MKNPSCKSTEAATTTIESSTQRTAPVAAGSTSLRIRSKVRAGLDGLATNHGLRVRSKVRAGLDGLTQNHGLRVRGA